MKQRDLLMKCYALATLLSLFFAGIACLLNASAADVQDDNAIDKDLTDKLLATINEYDANAQAASSARILLRLERGHPLPLTDAIREQLEKELQKRLAVLRSAREFGLATGDRAISHRIVAEPAFRKDGEFHLQTYKDVVRNRIGVTICQFEEFMREQLTIEKIQTVIGSAVWVTPWELQRLTSDFTDSFVVDYVVVKRDDGEEQTTFSVRMQRLCNDLKATVNAGKSFAEAAKAATHEAVRSSQFTANSPPDQIPNAGSFLRAVLLRQAGEFADVILTEQHGVVAQIVDREAQVAVSADRLEFQVRASLLTHRERLIFSSFKKAAISRRGVSSGAAVEFVADLKATSRRSHIEMALDPNTHPDGLLSLARSEDLAVQRAVAGNRNAPIEALLLLCKSTDREILTALLHHPHVPIPIKDQLLEISADSDLNKQVLEQRRNAERDSERLVSAITRGHLEDIIEIDSGTPIAALAMLQLARAHYDVRNWQKAYNLYTQFQENFPKHELLPVAEMGKIHCDEAVGKIEEALREFKAFRERHPYCFLSDVALLAQGRCLEQLKRFNDAAAIYKYYIKEHPNGIWFSRAEEALAYVSAELQRRE